MVLEANKIIEVTTRIKATGLVDQHLLDHLGIHAEGDFREMHGLGESTPNDPNSMERYEGTELELTSVECKLLSPDVLEFDKNKVSVVLAALRHFQGAIEAGEDLSYLSDIVDLDSLNHHEIDPLCEEINLGRAEEHYQVVAMSTGHLTEKDRDALAEAVSDGDQMALQRQSGFFLKLFDEESPRNYRHGHSETIKDIIRWAHQSGYRMIEFDCDAQVLPQFPVFDW